MLQLSPPQQNHECQWNSGVCFSQISSDLSGTDDEDLQLLPTRGGVKNM